MRRVITIFGCVLIGIASITSCKDEGYDNFEEQARIDSLKADSIAAARQAEFEANQPIGFPADKDEFFKDYFDEGHERPLGEYRLVRLPEGLRIKYNAGPASYSGELTKPLIVVNFDGNYYDNHGYTIEPSGEGSELWSFQVIEFKEKQSYEKVKRILEHSELTVQFKFPSGTFSNAMSSRFEFGLYDPAKFENAYVTRTQGKALVFNGDTIPVRFNGELSYPRYPGPRFD
jgi:hypothetical protein